MSPATETSSVGDSRPGSQVSSVGNEAESRSNERQNGVNMTPIGTKSAVFAHGWVDDEF